MFIVTWNGTDEFNKTKVRSFRSRSMTEALRSVRFWKNKSGFTIVRVSDGVVIAQSK